MADHHERLDVLGSLRARRTPSGEDLPGGAAQSVRPAREADASAIGAVQASTMAVSLAAGLQVGRLDPQLAAALDPAAMAQGWAAAITAPPTPDHRVLVAVQGEDVVGFAAIAPAVVEEQTTVVPPAPGGAELGGSAGSPPPIIAPGPAGTGAQAAAAGALQGRLDEADVLGVPPIDEAAAEANGGGSATSADAETAPQHLVEILALEVPAEHGRQGHGSRLMSACVDLAREQGATHVQTWAVQGEESRARFLDSCGFAPLGLRRESDVPGGHLVELCWEAAV